MDPILLSYRLLCRPTPWTSCEKMFGFVDDMHSPKELRVLAAWKVHTLTGGRKGTWSLSRSS
jgi:hypothetical protein